MNQKAQLGTGIKFPLQVNQTTGRFLLSQGADNVKESLYLILMTQQGERFTRQEFGSRIMAYPFIETSTTMLNIMAREIQNTILEQEPRIWQVEVEIEPDQRQGYLQIELRYMLRQTQTKDSMTVPFYIS